MKLIEFKNVAFTYESDEEQNEYEQKKVLDNLSFSIEKGSFVAILGHNGSGKSTVAKLINGIHFADSGEVIVNGQLAKDDDSIYDIRRNVGMVFQNPDNQIVSSIVEEDVAFGVENLGIEPSECRVRVDEALKNVGMYDYRLKAPSKLSGGQKQRVAIAGIIAMKPMCIVLDEPTAMLDPNGRKEVIQTVTELNRTAGVTVILITHYMDEVIHADKVYVMDDGHIVMNGTPREIFTQVDRLKELRLDVPQATELAYELKKAGVPIESGILTIEELEKAVAALKCGM